jgi:DNA-binding MarR family transcriptional regulator
LSTPVAERHTDPVTQVVAELRALSTIQDRLDHYAAQRFGLNRTDLRALDLIGQAGTTSPTALAFALGMSTGATSAVLDRLEAAGYARREPDPDHRRRTLVQMTAAAEHLSAQVFEPVIRATAAHAAGHTDRQLRDIAAFLATHRHTLEQYLDARPPAASPGEEVSRSSSARAASHGRTTPKRSSRRA